MTEINTRAPGYSSSIQYDKVVVDMPSLTDLYPLHIYTQLGNVTTSFLRNSYQNRISDDARKVYARIKAGGIAVEIRTPAGTFADDELPPYWQDYADMRNPFTWLRYEEEQAATEPTLTTVEQRRKDVTEWARANTTYELFSRATMNPAQATSPTLLDGRKWFAGQIWWAFVLHNLAAAQHDEWLEDANVWPAIRRNIELDGYQFLDHVAVNEWNEPAAYMDSFSRIYQAGAYLTIAPTNIQLVPPQTPVRPTLANGAAKARRIVYGG